MVRVALLARLEAKPGKEAEVADNATGETRLLWETRSQTTTLPAPNDLPSSPNAMIAVDLSAEAEGHPSWRTPVRSYFRRDGGGWKLVGFERLREVIPVGPAEKKAAR